MKAVLDVLCSRSARPQNYKKVDVNGGPPVKKIAQNELNSESLQNPSVLLSDRVTLKAAQLI
jgi:hypothetical protein